LGLVPHQKLMVGEHNIKVGTVITNQASLLGLVRPGLMCDRGHMVTGEPVNVSRVSHRWL
jgi:hypothetical protein